MAGIDDVMERLEALRTEFRDDLKGVSDSIKQVGEDMTEVKVKVGVIEGGMPHLATKEEVEKAKHEATKGKYGLYVGMVAFVVSALAVASRFMKFDA